MVDACNNTFDIGKVNFFMHKTILNYEYVTRKFKYVFAS